MRVIPYPIWMLLASSQENTLIYWFGCSFNICKDILQNLPLMTSQNLFYSAKAAEIFCLDPEHWQSPVPYCKMISITFKPRLAVWDLFPSVLAFCSSVNDSKHGHGDLVHCWVLSQSTQQNYISHFARALQITPTNFHYSMEMESSTDFTGTLVSGCPCAHKQDEFRDLGSNRLLPVLDSNFVASNTFSV